MIYSVVVSSSIDVVRDEMDERTKAIGFGVLKQYNFKEILKEKGYPIKRDITVFEICNPVAAHEALNAHPELSIYLPCRISLYEKDGDIILSTISIEEMIGNFTVDDNFKSHMNEVFDKLKGLMKSWE